MEKQPRISESEWQVMNLLWEESPMTANTIIEKLEKTASWKPKTVKTLISRLLKKEVISFEKEGREYKYYPLIPKEEYIKKESKSFLQRVYGGALNVMFANFLEEKELKKEDIEELKRILDQKKEKVDKQ